MELPADMLQHSKNSYIGQLTFPRFIAALIVVIFHYGKQTFPFQNSLFQGITEHGSFAVGFFFFLSGFVLAVNYLQPQKTDLKNYYVKRIARIYPLYITAFLLTLLLSMQLLHAYPKGFSIIMQLLGMQAWVPGICLEINYPGWSVSVEVFFYLIFPLIAFIQRKISFSAFIAFTLTLWLISQGIHYYLHHYFDDPGNPATGQFVVYFPLWHLNAFVFGISGGLIFKRTEKKQNGIIPFLLFLGSSALLILILSTHNAIRPYINNGLLSPIYLGMMLGLATDRKIMSKLWNHPLCIYLGNISYGIYLLQFSVHILFTYITGHKETNGVEFYGYILALIVTSAIMYQLVEKPMRKWVIKKFS